MGDALFCLLAFFGFAAVALVCGLSLRRQVAFAWSVVREDMDRFRRLPPLPKAMLVAVVAGFIAYGSTKTNHPPAMLTAPAPRCDDGGISCTIFDQDIARGWQVWEVRTDAAVDYAMPEGATLATNWWVRGAYEDVVRVDFARPVTTPVGESADGMVAGWRFLFGTNEYDSAWAFTWGKLRFALADTNAEIVAVGAQMSAVPYRSRLWTAADTNGSRFVTWENFFLNRDTNTPVNAQIEFRPDGDFITRSNGVETVCRRVDPNDFDGDGWHNDDDPAPFFYEELNEDLWQELPDGANTNAYCWIDLRAEYRTWVVFEGDGPSDLPDPSFTAGPGRTYRVQLLIGKTYRVSSDRPLTVVGKSSPDILVDGNGTCELTVCWPVTFTVEPGHVQGSVPTAGTGSSFCVLPNPRFLGGEVRWDELVGCCSILGDGTNFAYACDSFCRCQGCSSVGYYWYGGYVLMVFGPSCGCGPGGDSEPPELLHFGFTRAAAFYEDPYTNMPGVVVHPAPSNSTLRCSVKGGTCGGRLTITLNEVGSERLAPVSGELPTDEEIAPGTERTFEVEYTPVAPSGAANDIVATAVYVENETGVRHEGEATLTSVKVELEADKTAPENPDRHRHVYGIAEDIHYRSYPASADVTWTFPETFINRGTGWVMCPWSRQGLSGSVTAQAGGAAYEFCCTVVEPGIEVRNPRVNAESTLVSPVIGEAGHLLLYLDLYAIPLYVSFEGVQMREVPDESQSCPHQGYYDDQSKGGSWSHTANDGAGGWHTVSSSGYVMSDRAGRRTSYQTPWVSGWKEWDIPMEWGEGGVIHVPFNPNPTTQRFELRGDGLFTIRKHGHFAERNVFGLKWCDGELVW